MVPELAGAAAAELTGLREAVVEAARALPRRWLVIGTGATDAVVSPDRRGTFAGYGVDVPVALGPDAEGAPTELPLCALIAGWVRGQVDPAASAEVRVYADSAVDAAVSHGRALRTELDESADPTGVLVVADGAHTLTPAAPGGHEPDSVPLQRRLDDALAVGDTSLLTRLPAVGRVAYQVLAGLGETPRGARELYRGAPYGVGYFVGIWTP